MTDMQLREIKDHLLQGVDRLGAQGLGISLTLENCPDETDFASQLTQQGMNVVMQRRRIARMSELESALKRLGQTHYGMCEECEESIGVARLKANPSARLCVNCQSAAEEHLNHCA